MASNARTSQRNTTQTRRFSRTGTTSGRPSSTAGRSLRARANEPGAKGRFGLGGSLGPAKYGRGTSAGRSGKKLTTGRKRATVGKAITLLGKSSAAKSAPNRGRAKPAAGLALLAGAAGMALRNRERISGMMGKGHSDAATPVTNTEVTPVIASPVPATDPVGSPDANTGISGTSDGSPPANL